MNRKRLEAEIREDEGYRNAPYFDHLGNLTVGVGHLIREGEPETREWTDAEISKAFQQDLEYAIHDCRRLCGGFERLPEDAQHVMAGLSFQLGGPRLSRFRNMLAAVNAKDWETASDELLDSRYASQVPARANRYAARFRALG